MPYIVIFIGILAGIVFFVTYNSVKAEQQKQQTQCSVISIENTPLLAAGVKTNSFLSKQDIITQLKELAQKPAPKKLSMGAMCYKVAGPPDRVEYVCPVCGEKTLYANNKNNMNDNYRVISLIDRDLPVCRTTIKKIKGIKIELDETQFCKKCSPKIKEPQLGMVVYYESDKPYCVWGVSENDILLLSEFFSGSDKHQSDYGQEYPLKDSIERLEQLLGVSIK